LESDKNADSCFLLSFVGSCIFCVYGILPICKEEGVFDDAEVCVVVVVVVVVVVAVVYSCCNGVKMYIQVVQGRSDQLLKRNDFELLNLLKICKNTLIDGFQ
jgi:hypothetical protein